MNPKEEIRARAQALVQDAWEAGLFVEVTLSPIIEPDPTQPLPRVSLTVIEGGLGQG